jgi:endo-1,4-beta-xylanase
MLEFRAMKRHSLFALFALLWSIAPAEGASLTLRSGWVFVPGAQDLIAAGQWNCVAGVTLSSDALAISASAGGYSTVIDTNGPVLKVPGDFSVVAEVSNPAAGSGGFLTMVGTLSTGPNWWNGLNRLDVGLFGTQIMVDYWTGSSQNATTQTFNLGQIEPNLTVLEVARMGGQIVVFVNGSEAGSFADPGLFGSGQLYFGFNVEPGDTLNVLGLAAAMPVGGNDSLFSPGTQGATRTGSALRDLAAPSGLLIGAAVDPSFFPNATYVQALGREFNFIVPENDLKFAETEPAAHQFSFCLGDQILSYAIANDMKMRGHNLVWGEDLPDWLTGGNYTSTDASAILLEHINNVVGHYKGKLVDWDVVNEAVSDSPPYSLNAIYWLNQLGSGYLDQAFQWAHAADPNAKLFYNDYGGEGLGGKSDAIYNLVKGMLSRGVPINGVGLESHFELTGTPSEADISANMARLAALGLEVHVSEMDVRLMVDSNGNASAADLASQATLYQNVFAACQANSNCTAFLTWGVGDPDSWIPSAYPGFGAGLMLDANYQPRPAYNSVGAQLRSAAVTAPVISPNGMVIHGGASAIVSPGSLVDIYGSELAGSTATAPGAPLPNILGNVQVTVNGTPAPLYYVSSGQVDFQIPYSVTPGSALVQVSSNGIAGRSAAITVQQAAPSLLTYVDAAGKTRAVAQNQDYTVNSATNCAAPNSYVTAYLIGSGPLNNPVPTGAAALSSPLSSETLETTACIGVSAARVSFAGMAPGFVGLMQVNLQVPQVSGDLPLQIQVGTFASNQALLCVAD